MSKLIIEFYLHSLYFVIKYGNNMYKRYRKKEVEIMGLPAILGLLIVIGSLAWMFYGIPIDK